MNNDEAPNPERAEDEFVTHFARWLRDNRWAATQAATRMINATIFPNLDIPNPGAEDPLEDQEFQVSDLLELGVAPECAVERNERTSTVLQ